MVIFGALWALDRLDLLAKIPFLLVFNGDEEIGSPHSGHKLLELARSCRLGLVFECGGLEGSVFTSRRGLRRYRLKILGKAGLPTVDGLGPVGERDHSKEERILKDSLFHRIQLLVHLLWDLRLWAQDRSM